MVYFLSLASLNINNINICLHIFIIIMAVEKYIPESVYVFFLFLEQWTAHDLTQIWLFQNGEYIGSILSTAELTYDLEILKVPIFIAENETETELTKKQLCLNNENFNEFKFYYL